MDPLVPALLKVTPPPPPPPPLLLLIPALLQVHPPTHPQHTLPLLPLPHRGLPFKAPVAQQQQLCTVRGVAPQYGVNLGKGAHLIQVSRRVLTLPFGPTTCACPCSAAAAACLRAAAGGSGPLGLFSGDDGVWLAQESTYIGLRPVKRGGRGWGDGGCAGVCGCDSMDCKRVGAVEAPHPTTGRSGSSASHLWPSSPAPLPHHFPAPRTPCALLQPDIPQPLIPSHTPPNRFYPNPLPSAPPGPPTSPVLLSTPPPPHPTHPHAPPPSPLPPSPPPRLTPASWPPAPP
jgi:hypothetical protein